MARFNLRLEDEMKGKLRIAAELENTSMNEIINRALDDWFEGYDKKEKIKKIIDIKLST